MKIHLCLRLLAISVIFFVFSGCSHLCPTNKLLEEIMPGYSMHPAPNELDKPGLVFMVKSDGVRIDVMQLEGFTVHTGIVAIQSYKGERDIALGFMFNFIGLEIKNIHAETGMNAEKKFIFRLKLHDGAFEERITLLELEKALQQNRELIEKIKKYNGNKFKFYVIMESVLAEGIDYGFSKELTRNQSLVVKLEKLATLKEEFRWDNTAEYQLSQKFKKPLRIFYKCVQIIFATNNMIGIKNLGGRSGEAKIELKKIETSEPLYLRKAEE